MKATFPLIAGLSLASLLSVPILTHSHAQSDADTPTFRPRTDFNAKSDLQLLREELNRASDAEGAINPLGEYIERNSQEGQRKINPPLEMRPADREADPVDNEAEERPRIEPKSMKQNAPSKPSTVTQSPSIAILPGPHYTIIQPATPQYSATIFDNFRPLAQYPVSLAASSYVANQPEIPFGSSSNSNILPANILGGGAANNNAILPDAATIPVYPYNAAPLPGSASLAPPNSTFPNQPPPQPYYPTQPGLNPGIAGAAPMRSPSDGMPNYSRQAPMVNGPPFVSGAPCRYDARNMVSQDLYRQAVDPCAPARCSPTGYAPYATQPSGGGLSYIPPTYMPNNNGYNSGYRPLIGFGQTLDNAYLGRGIIGQPTAYVDGQPVRNFIRYLFP